jgi:hypothetical protein
MTAALGCGTDPQSSENDDPPISITPLEVDDVMDELRAMLVQRNSEHYAFGFLDILGGVLDEYASAAALASDAGSVIEHVASDWVIDAQSQPGSEPPSYMAIYDPESPPTSVVDLQMQDVVGDYGPLLCLLP